MGKYFFATAGGTTGSQFRMNHYDSDLGTFSVDAIASASVGAGSGQHVISDAVGNFYAATDHEVRSYDSDFNLRTSWAISGVYTLPLEYVYGLTCNPVDNSMALATSNSLYILNSDGSLRVTCALTALYSPLSGAYPCFTPDGTEVLQCIYGSPYTRIERYNTTTGVNTGLVKNRISYKYRAVLLNSAGSKLYYIARGNSTGNETIYCENYPALGTVWTSAIGPSNGNRLIWDITQSNLYHGGGGEDQIRKLRESDGVVTDVYDTGTTSSDLFVGLDGTVYHTQSSPTLDQDGDTQDTRLFTGALVKIVGNTAGDSPRGITVGSLIPLAIDSQTASQTAHHETPLTLEVVVSGSEPKTYQWKMNGTSIPGETASTYTITTPVTESAGTYTCEISNPYESIVSEDIVIKVAPYILDQPSPTDITVRAGNSLSIALVAGGGPGLSYQWKLDGVAILGSTSDEYSTSHVAEDAGGSYTCTLSISGDPSVDLDTNASVVTVLPQLVDLKMRMFDIPLDNDIT